MRLYTIGFTKKPAERFFNLLREHGVTRVLDIRLRPGGQLAGFAKGDDLAYFLRALVGCDYVHLPALAPNDAILEGFRQTHDWTAYERQFEALMDGRAIPASLDYRLFDGHTVCLLCSEDRPEQCHRRLVAERLARHWPGTEIVHIV